MGGGNPSQMNMAILEFLGFLSFVIWMGICLIVFVMVGISAIILKFDEWRKK